LFVNIFVRARDRYPLTESDAKLVYIESMFFKAEHFG